MSEQKMTKDDLFNHQLTINTYDSFGRAIAYKALEIAKEIVAKEPIEKVSFDINIRVEAWGVDKCRKIGAGNKDIGYTWISVENL